MAANPPLRAKTSRTFFSRPSVLAVVIAVLTSVLLTDLVPLYAPGLLRFEHALGDYRTALLSDRLDSQHPGVAVVGIGDQTLNDYKTRQPIDRALLARVIDAVDAAEPKVIGLDVLFARTVPPDNEDELIEALRRAKAKVVLAAGDERLRLTPAQASAQTAFIARTGRAAGFANLATERDWVVRFQAGPYPGSTYPHSFARLLVEAAGHPQPRAQGRIAWLLEPRDESDVFFYAPAEALLAADSPAAAAARQGLKNKIVIIGGVFPDVDQHLTPLSSRTHEQMAGAMIHSHIVAQMIDRRRVGQLDTNAFLLRVSLAVLAGMAFLVGWRYRFVRGGLLSSAATIIIVAIDTFVFWQFRIILPIVLAVTAWFLSEFLGHHLGRWLGRRPPERARWFGK